MLSSNGLVGEYEAAETGSHDVYQTLADGLADTHRFREFLSLAGAEVVAQRLFHVDDVAQDLISLGRKTVAGAPWQNSLTVLRSALRSPCVSVAVSPP
jgi:hypothetical protein